MAKVGTAGPRPVDIPAWQRLVRGMHQLWAWHWENRARRATIAVLHSLDDHALKDIGIDRSEIESVVYARSSSRRAR